MENQDYSLQDILKVLAKNKKYILYTTIGAAILSAIISLLMPVYYKSLTSFYAASPDLGLPNVIGVTELPRDVYGTDYDIDRLLSLAESDDVYGHLISKFDLYNHYDIDPSKVKAPYTIREELKDLYKVLKTKLGAIELTVEDKDPIFAANMANEARERINFLSQNLMKESQNATLGSYKANLASQNASVNAISDSIKFYRQKYNIINTESQGEVYSELLAKANASNESNKAALQYFKESRGSRDSIRKYTILSATSSKKLAALNGEMKIFNSGSSKVEQLVIEYERLINQFALDKQREKLLQSAYSAPFKALHVVEVASPPVIKSKPLRSLIVIASTFLAFILSSAFVLLKSNMSGWNWRELWDA